MKKKITTLTLTVSISLWALAQAPIAQAANCGNGPLVFHVGQFDLKAVPHTKCLAPGESYTIKIVQNGGHKVALNDVTINPKPGNPGPDGWLVDQKNSTNALEITIYVPSDANPDDEYRYLINVKGVGELDPVIKVKR